MKKIIIELSIFLVLLLCSMFYLGNRLDIEMESSYRIIKPYFDQGKNADVLTLGSSHVIYGIQTKLIEDKTIYNSAYNLAHTGQTIAQSYFLLKQSISNDQVPKVVIVDVFGLFLKKSQISYLKYSKTYKRLNDSKIAKEYSDEVDIKIYPINFFNVHNNWKYLSIKDFFNLKEKIIFEDNFKNQVIYNGYVYEESFISEISLNNFDKKNFDQIGGKYIIYEELNTFELQYIDKIIELCKRNNIKLKFIKTPVINFHIEKESYERLYRLINNYLEIKGYSYLDFNTDLVWEKSEIEYKLDFRNNGHLNISGANKITNYLISHSLN